MDVLLGLVFAFLWASGAVAAKLGFHDAPPLTILDARFLLAGALLLMLNYGIRRGSPLPRKGDWKHLVILALANSVIYLGLSWLALRQVSAGVFNLFATSNPFIVAVLSSILLKRDIKRQEWIGMLVSAVGLVIATAPLLSNSQATPGGILMVAIAVTTYAAGSVYFKWAKVQLPGMVINSWQIAIGAFLLMPFAAAMNGPSLPTVTPVMVEALAWSVFAISILCLFIWFYLLKKDPVRASMWMFLSPVFGYVQAAVVLGEPIRATDIIGTLLVMLGLVLSGTIEFKRPAFAFSRP